jgi:gliding motility-associated-like protein
MENIFKNKLSNYEETPPGFILENLKNEIKRGDTSFIARNKYFIVASVIAVAIVSFVIMFNNASDNIAENHQILKNSTPKINSKKNETQLIKTQHIETKSETTKTNISKERIVSTNTKPQDTQNIKTEKQTIINKGINAGIDATVCGNTYKMNPVNAENGEWISENYVDIKEKNNPNTEITTEKFGATLLIWREKISDKYITDTVKITFINTPESDIEIEQTNEICANKNAEINFITDNKYSYNWSDGLKTNENFRKNLSAGTYTITVSNNQCSSIINVDILNTGNLKADFYHTELYSAVNIPFYFTNRTVLEGVENTKISYEWYFGDGATSNEDAPEHTYKKYGDYNVKLIAIANNGCKDSLSMKITVNEKEVRMPNIFTPNGDGKHDILILNPKPLKGYYAVVYDRSGREITHWTDVNKGWDGKLKSGDNASEGVYFYIVSGIDSDGNKFNYKSFVHLSR